MLEGVPVTLERSRPARSGQAAWGTGCGECGGAEGAGGIAVGALAALPPSTWTHCARSKSMSEISRSPPMKATTAASALLALALFLPVSCSAEGADPLARVHKILIARHAALSAIAASPSTPPFSGALASAGSHLALAAAHAFESTGHLEDLAAVRDTPDIERATAGAVDALERASRECEHAGALTLIGTLAAEPEHLADFAALFLTPADQHVTREDLVQAAREHASGFRSEIRTLTEEVYSNAALIRKKATALSESRFHFGALTALPLADSTRSLAHYLADHSANFAPLITQAQTQHTASD